MAVVMGGFHTVYRAPNFNGTRTAKVTVFYGTISSSDLTVDCGLRYNGENIGVNL